MAELYKNDLFYKKDNLTVSQSLERGNNNLDLVRIIAALMVIFGHSFALTLTPNMQEPFNYFFPFTYSGSIAVKVFFFISGLLVTNSIIKSKSISEFTVARFFRIYPAFAITIILTGIAIGPLAYNGGINDYINNPGVFNYISHSLFFDTQYFINGVFSGNRDGGSINGSLWTIAIEVSAYAVVLAIFIFTGFKRKTTSNIILLSIIIIPLTDINGLNFIVDRNSEAYLLPSCFALGSIFAINKKSIKLDFRIPVGFFIIYKTSYSTDLSHFAFYAGICTSLLYISTFKLIKSIRIKNDISYGIYLWGFPIQQLLSYYYKLDTVSLIIFSSIISIVVGYFSFVLIERPSMRLGKSILNRLQLNKLESAS